MSLKRVGGLVGKVKWERLSFFHFQLAEAGLSLLWDGMEYGWSIPPRLSRSSLSRSAPTVVSSAPEREGRSSPALGLPFVFPQNPAGEKSFPNKMPSTDVLGWVMLWWLGVGSCGWLRAAGLTVASRLCAVTVPVHG